MNAEFGKWLKPSRRFRLDCHCLTVTFDMPVALDRFVQQLEDSGILAGDTIKDFIPPKASAKDAEELARELVRKKKLTRFQAEEVSKGKGKSLVLGNYVLM